LVTGRQCTAMDGPERCGRDRARRSLVLPVCDTYEISRRAIIAGAEGPAVILGEPSNFW